MDDIFGREVSVRGQGELTMGAMSQNAFYCSPTCTFLPYNWSSQVIREIPAEPGHQKIGRREA